MARKWQKTAIFSWNFDLFLTFFMDCGHIYVPNGKTWGSTSRPHIGDVVMSLFFTLGSTVHDWGWPKNGPFWTKNGQTWQACQRSKVVQRGPKGTKMVNLSLFDHLGPRLGPPFMTGDGPKMVHFWPKIAQHGRLVNVKSGLKGFKRGQYGKPKCFWPFGTFWGPSGSFWTISDNNDFLPRMDKVGFCRGASEQNINSCLKLSKMVQMGPKGFHMVKNT